MIVAKVLEPFPELGRASWIVATGSCPFRRNIDSENCRTCIEIKRYRTLQTNRGAKIGPGGKIQRTAASRGNFLDGLVNRGAVDRLAVTRGAEASDIMDDRSGGGGSDACALKADCGIDVSPEAEPIPAAKAPLKKSFLVIPLGNKFPPKSKRTSLGRLRDTARVYQTPHPLG